MAEQLVDAGTKSVDAGTKSVFVEEHHTERAVDNECHDTNNERHGDHGDDKRHDERHVENAARQVHFPNSDVIIDVVGDEADSRKLFSHECICKKAETTPSQRQVR